MLYQLLCITLLICLGLYSLFLSKQQSALLVFEDLADDELDGPHMSERLRAGQYIVGDELAKAGLLHVDDRNKFMQQQKLIPVSTVLFVAMGAFFARVPMSTFVVIVIAAFSLSYIYTNQRLRKFQEAYVCALEYGLPMVMERLVMAVEAGLDILSALATLAKLDAEELAYTKISEPCPVTRLLKIVLRLTEAGLPFEQSLQRVANGVTSSALRHAFIHLGNAHRDGGELIRPLRELSDATQLYFQETVEEEVAKAPVKATLPLVLTFVGLVMSFLAIPLFQVVDTLGKANLPMEQGVGIEREQQ